MKLSRRINYVLVLLFTVCSISLMIYFKGSAGIQDGNYNTPAVTGIEDGKYLGYIFDDYNKKVNLGYSEDVPPGEDNIINIISLSALDMEYDADNIRAIKSERIINEKATKNEYYIDPVLVYPAYKNMEDGDKTEFADVVCKLDKHDAELLRLMLCSETSSENKQIIMEGLKGRLTGEELEFLSGLTDKYTGR